MRASGDYTWNPADWSVVLQDGSTAHMLVRPAGDATPNGWPNYPMMYTEPATIDHAMALPAFSIAEVPATGRITLEYRPSGRHVGAARAVGRAALAGGREPRCRGQGLARGPSAGQRAMALRRR